MIPRGPQGKMLDYVPFYFGYHSPMLYRLHTKQVQDYTEGQSPLLYLVTTAQAISEGEQGYVFSDGHGVKKITKWFDDLIDLNKVDWDMVKEKYWTDNNDDNDRKRRKQAEFLVHGQCAWSLIQEIVVFSEEAKSRVQKIFDSFPSTQHKTITVKKKWYY